MPRADTKILQRQIDANAGCILSLLYSAPDFDPPALHSTFGTALKADRCWCSQCHQNLNSKQWRRGGKNTAFPYVCDIFLSAFSKLFSFFWGLLLCCGICGECFCFAISFCGLQRLTVYQMPNLRFYYNKIPKRISVCQGQEAKRRGYEPATVNSPFWFMRLWKYRRPTITQPQNDKDEKRARSAAMEMW